MLALLLALLLPAGLLQDGNLVSRMDDAVARLEGSTGARTWDVARDLRDLARSDSIAAVPWLVERAARSSDEVKLVLAGTLADPDVKAADEAAKLLLPLLDGEHAAQALALLAADGFHRVPEVGERLAQLLEQPLPPERRIDVARTLYRVGASPARAEARTALRDALHSDDPDARARAAFALAEINDFDSAREVLQTLRSDPGPDGQLARAYLQTDEQIQYYSDHLLRQSDQLQRPARTPEPEPEHAPGKGNLDVLEELIERIQDGHLMGDQLQGDDGREHLIVAAAKGMLSSLDPHSTFFTSKDYERWILDLRRNYAGIGAYVDTINGEFTITRPIYSGPAYKLGLQAGDRIFKVDGWDTHDQQQDEIIKRLKGEPGTEVKVSVVRDGWTQLRDFVIKREVIHIDSVESEMLPGGIGYVDIVSFAENTSDELLAAIESLRSQGLRGLIVDVRRNSGGYLEEAVGVCSLFLKPGQLVVYTEGRGVERQDYPARAVRGRYDGPLVVLVNGLSASASEIVAGSLQDNHRAAIVGEKTFGKGSVQQAMPLQTRKGDRLTEDRNYNGTYDPGDGYEDDDGDGAYTYASSIKLTNARYYLPSGRSIHTELDLQGRVIKPGGVTPDDVVEFRGLQPWENNEIAQLYDRLLRDVPEGETFKDPFDRYLDATYAEHRDLFAELADGDGRDPSRYPGFDALRASLDDSHLTDDTLRRLLRQRVRDRVADERGRAFPGGFILGDCQEDSQLQEAIRRVASEASVDLTAWDDYRSFAEEKPVGPSPADGGAAEPR